MFNSPNKKSLVLLIVGLFWLSYVAISGTQFYWQVVSATEAKTEDRRVRMAYAQEQIFSALISKNIDLVEDQLEKARSIFLLDFYILQKGDQAVFGYNNGDLKSIDVNYQTYNQWLATDKIAFRTLKVFDYKLTTGLFQDKSALIKETAWQMRGYIFREIFSVTAALAAIVYLILRDIIKLSKVLSGKNRQNVQNIKANSSEAQALINASKGLEGERNRLSLLSETYSQTVGPAIVHEIKSGKAAPYQFSATMCRVDLNGYTQLMLERDPNYLNQILNSYFAVARETIDRYGGLIYQFVGDEIIFQFKDELAPGQNSTAMATACIRDLFAQAKSLEDSLPETANHYFKLKASFAHGTMRFISLDEGHALSGIPLIESVRLLSTVEDKSNQILTFFEDAHELNQDLVLVSDRQHSQLKGFKESSKICCTQKFKSIEDVFTNQSWSLLKYYRSDTELIFTLQKIQNYAQSGDLNTLELIFENLKTHTLSDFTPALAETAEQTLSSFMDLEDQKVITEKTLASYISLYQRLMPDPMLRQESYHLLQKLLSHENARVQANTVMAMGPSLKSAPELRKRITSNNNRLAADALVELAKIELDKGVYKALIALIDHNQASYRKSGEYARRKILEYYQEVDPVFFESNPILNSLKKTKAAA